MAQKRLDVRIKTLYLEREKFENYPIFQRELVWPLSVKRTLIDTILRDMYLHPLLVHERKTDAQEIKYYIIDGQQRLSTIFEFMDGKFATTSVALNRKEEPAFLPPIEPNKYYAQLSPEARNTFDDYMLNLYVLAHIDDPMVGLIFRRVQNQVPLSLAEKLWSYTSKTANLAVELAKHPIWTEWFAGPINRRQNFQGSLYPIFIEIARGYANMTTPRLRDLVGGTKDKEITPKLVQKIHERLDAMMHAFAGTPFTLKEEIVAMYQAILFLETSKELSVSAGAKGRLTPWMAKIQAQPAHRLKRGVASIFSTLVYTSVQRDFWEIQFPLLVRQYTEGDGVFGELGTA